MSLGRGIVSALLCAFAVACVAMAPAPARAAAPEQCGTPRLGTILYLQPGAFVVELGESRLRAACEELGRRGFAARPVRYRLRDVPGALEDARREAQSARSAGPVFAYGESAGGTLAAMLAIEHRVDAAVTVAAPTNLLSWEANNTAYWQGLLRMTEADRAAASPVFSRGEGTRPVLLMHSRRDRVVPYAQSAELAGELRDADLVELAGPHLGDPTARARGLNWLRRRAIRSGPAPGRRGPWFTRG